MDNMERKLTKEEKLALATQFSFSDPSTHYMDSIIVEYRGDDLYAVCRPGDYVWNGEAWEYEPTPSNRDQKFLDRTRFDLDTALIIARRLFKRSE